ncbi:hypothetical protein [Thauera aromatica]|uniref:hypothetical protein n=1 Tax=Thauera aromatica TaxID=59405 RepID=UPI001FFD1748|nr:hypothetical protein [Thauera aromatica]MCK2095654.1 hypothetical protein [Thauera aromatica]
MNTLFSAEGQRQTQRGTDGAAHVFIAGGAIGAALTPAADGVPLPLASLAQTLAYNPDGTVSYIQVTHAGTAYRQTLTYTDGNLTAVSAWEAQP